MQELVSPAIVATTLIPAHRSASYHEGPDDVGFVLNRAAVFGIVSAIVIGAFIGASGHWLVSASHTTSVVSGMVVALAVGLSLRYIRQYADAFVDGVFFRKRPEDEAALRRFAGESAYVSDREILLNRAFGKCWNTRKPTTRRFSSVMRRRVCEPRRWISQARRR